GLGTNNPQNFILDANGNVGPHRDLAYNLGSSTMRWNKIFVSTLNASTMTTTLTPGSVVFIDGSGNLGENNANFNWSNSNNKLNITGSVLVSGQVNGATANFTTGNITTINSTRINNSATITGATINGTNLNISSTINGGTFDGDFTNGSMLFANNAGVISQNNTQVYWDRTNNRMGIGTNNPSQKLDINGQVRIRGGNPLPNYILAAIDNAGNGRWMSASALLNNGGAFLNALNDAISDNNYNLFLGNGAGLVHSGVRNTGLGIDAMRTITSGNGNTALGFKAANGMTSGSNNIFIGSLVNGSSATASNELNIGNAIFGNLSNGNIGIGVQNPNNFKLQVAGNVGPQTDSTHDLGSPTIRWANSYSDNFNGATANITTISTTTLTGVNATFTGTVNGSSLVVDDATVNTLLTVKGLANFSPSAVVSISSGSGVNAIANTILRVQGNGGPVTISANPQITTTSINDGQILIIKGTSDTNTVTITNGSGVSLSDGLAFTLGQRDTITLYYDAVDNLWTEINRSDQ
ncbi:MAG: hypothetical protein LW817_04790, partial [Candidatus Caenarcaniphilales bacterium]|nr:hypothetical protein [Candidatus Caenarcaniphilales bacterium]